MSTPATFKSFGHPLQATSPFPRLTVHLTAKVALLVDKSRDKVLTAVTQGSPRPNSTGHGAKRSDACLFLRKGVHLDTELTLPEVRLGGRRKSDDLLLLLLHLDKCRMVALAILVRFQGVGETSGQVILQLQNTNDLTAACSNSHHSENSELTRPEPKDSWIGTCLNFIQFDILSRNQDKLVTFQQIRSYTCRLTRACLEILTTLTFGALREKSHCFNSVRDHCKKNETSSSTCGQQCIMNCQEHNQSWKIMLRGKNLMSITGLKKKLSVLVDKLPRREFSHYGLN